MGGKRTGSSNSRCGTSGDLSLPSKRLGAIAHTRLHSSRPESVICLDEAPPPRSTYVDNISLMGTGDCSLQREASLRATNALTSRFGQHLGVTFATANRGGELPDGLAAISLKAALISAVIVVFGILHVIGAVLLHDAAAPDRSTPPR
jgi:hypothetical protein